MASETVDRSRNMEEKSWWDLWNTSYRSADAPDENSVGLFAHVVKLMRGIAPGRILEIACGTGTVSRSLEFTSYHGLDISAAAINIAQQKGQDFKFPAQSAKASYEAADFHDWALPAEGFDTVLCVDAISCFRNQEIVIKKMAQALRTNGLLLLTTVNPIVYRRIRRVGGVKLENGPVSHWLPRRELHSLVLQAGLVIERSYTILPRGNMGFLRIVNSHKLNRILGPGFAACLRALKEQIGLGQYRVLIARKLTG